MRLFSWPNRSDNFFYYKSKKYWMICTKQYDRLFPGARSHGQQMGEKRHETEVQRMVRNTVEKLIGKWKWIRKYHDQVHFIHNETLTCRMVNRLLKPVNFVLRKRNYFSWLESIRNICRRRRWLNRFPYRSIYQNRSFWPNNWNQNDFNRSAHVWRVY